MIQAHAKNVDYTIPAEGTQVYISQMLNELSAMAQNSGLKELASLLRATVAASQVDLSSDNEA